MRIVAVDDERRALDMLRILIGEIEDAEVAKGGLFTDGEQALVYLRSHPVDAVFLDIEMSGINGLELAEKIEGMPYHPNIVFVTGYQKYAYDAWKTEAAAYLLKPYGRNELEAVLDRCRRLRPSGRNPSVEARCFPSFDLYVDGKPLAFHNYKAKELLAFLVHQQGRWVNVGQIVYCLFGEEDEKTGKNYYNVLSYRLRNILCEAGIGALLETGYGKCRIQSDLIQCDYYNYLNGDKSLFCGDYMQQYSWAEPTVAAMMRENNKN